MRNCEAKVTKKWVQEQEKRALFCFFLRETDLFRLLLCEIRLFAEGLKGIGKEYYKSLLFEPQNCCESPPRIVESPVSVVFENHNFQIVRMREMTRKSIKPRFEIPETTKWALFPQK